MADQKSSKTQQESLSEKQIEQAGDQIKADSAVARSIYGHHKSAETKNSQPKDSPLIPAATVVLLRDSADQLEVLMLRKNINISFGGMWVFPGGKLDAEDFEAESLDLPETQTQLRADSVYCEAARRAARRETQEETGLNIVGDLQWMSHWKPPASTPKRFSTWFFVAASETVEEVEQEVGVDGQEILQHQWVTPEQALDMHRDGKIQLAPPTWLSLHHLSLFGDTAQALKYFSNADPLFYATKLAPDAEGVLTAMWQGDAGYESGDAKLLGPRHRLVMAEEGYSLEDSTGYYGL